MSMTYDPGADAIYVYFRGEDEKSARTQTIREDAVYVDWTREGDLLGVELLNVSNGVDLDGVPRSSEVAAMIEHVHGVRLLTV